MKFEFSFAIKYLVPRARQLSVSIIGFVSLLVISLVVWLVLLFLSITEGMEKNWIGKLVSLNAPLRVQPTPAYYSSYYYLADRFASASAFRNKTLAEKLQAERADPYNPDEDPRLPASFPQPATAAGGALIDLAKEAKEALLSLQADDLLVTDYEIALGQMRLRQLRFHNWSSPDTEGFITQATYLASFDSQRSQLASLLIEPDLEDLNNHLFLIPLMGSEDPAADFNRFFEAVDVRRIGAQNARLSPALLPPSGQFRAFFSQSNRRIVAATVPTQQGQGPANGILRVDKGRLQAHLDGESQWQELPGRLPLFAQGPLEFEAAWAPESAAAAARAGELLFDVEGELQGQPLKGRCPLGEMRLVQARIDSACRASPWATSSTPLSVALPESRTAGEPILLARTFKDSGVKLGDRGHISYFAPTAGAPQEMRLAVYVAGFYDAGLMPGKFVMMRKEAVAQIAASQGGEAQPMSGFQAWFARPSDAPHLKALLQQELQRRGISPYFEVQAFEDYDFAKDLVAQLKSDRNLFTLIALVIIVVACSNIVSMLLLLVHDKKREIGVLQALGATPRSVAAIFGIAGVVLGLASSVVGTAAAYFTMRHLDQFIRLLSRIQGQEVFNKAFYGTTLPSEISASACTTVLLSTCVLSLIAGLIPSLKASRYKPAEILRSES